MLPSIKVILPTIRVSFGQIVFDAFDENNIWQNVQNIVLRAKG